MRKSKGCGRILVSAVALAVAAEATRLINWPAGGRSSVYAAVPASGPAILSASSQPASTRPTTGPASTQPASISLNFKDVPIDVVLEHLSNGAGFVIVKEVPVEGRVTVFSAQPLSPDESVTLLNTVLKSNGFTAIQTGRTLKITARDKAKKSNVPVHFGANATLIEPTDDLITQVIPVLNVDAVKLKQDLAPLLSTDADVTANGGSNAIVVTDTSSNIRRVVEIITALDRNEPSNSEIKRYTLKNSSATATAKLIVSIFKPTDLQAGRTPEGKQREGEQALRSKMNAVADDRTNTLFVTASTETLRIIDSILKELEANPAASSEIRVFNPKYADASAAAKLISTIFRPEELGVRSDGSPRYRDGSLDQALKSRVIAAADDRSNTLVVTAPTDTMKIIEDVLKRMDVNPSDVVELKVIPLVYTDGASVVKVISSVFRPDDGKAATPDRPRPPGTTDQPLNARVNVASDDRTNSVIISAPKETIKVIEGMLKLLDVNPATASTTKIIQLQHADAAAAVRLINTIYKADDSTSPASPYAAKPPADAGSVADRQRRARLTVAADDRTNALIVSAPPDMMLDIESVVTRLDSNPVSDEAFFIYRLKNGQSNNVESVLNTLFGTGAAGALGGAGGFGGGGGRNGMNGQRGGANGQLNALALAQQGSNTRAGGTGIGNRRGSQTTGYGGQGFQGFPQGVGGFPGQVTPGILRAASELTGQVFVVADQDTNSLLITTATKYKDRVQKIIEELDRPVPQVLIKVLVAEVTHDDSADLGLDFSVLNRRPNGQGTSISSAFGNASQTTGLVVSMLENKLNAQLHLLATSGKLDVLSRPYILASDNQQASITVGQEVPFITNSRTTDQGQTINTIEYQDVGIILNVTPHINPDGQVILDVAPEISQLTGTTVPISANASAPVIAKRSAQSRVGVKNGHTIVIGGLMEDRKTSTISKLPLLGDIPLLGVLFSRTEVTKSKTELLIFLTPHVALQPEALGAMTDEEVDGTRLTPKAVAPGTFDEHMQGLQRGSTPMTRPATQP